MESIVKVIGVPEVTVDGIRHTRFRSHRIPALIGFLASQDGSATRKTVAQTLWTGTHEDRARHNLRQTLVYCRQLLGKECIVAHGEVLSLSKSIEVDRVRWNELVSSVGIDKSGTQASECLLNLAEQVFLTGLDDDWVIEERERMRSEAVRIISEFSERLIPFDPERALEASRRLSRIDPADEAGTRAQLRSLVALGRHDEAKAILNRFEDYLTAAFGLPPSSSLRAFLQGGVSDRTSPSIPRLHFDSAIQTLVDLKQWNEAAELAISWAPYLERCGLAAMGLPAYEAIQDTRTSKFPPPLEARFTLALARIYHLAGLERKAMSISLDMARQSTSPRVRANAYLLACRAATRLFLVLEAQRCLKESMRISRENGLQEELQSALLYSVEVALRAGDFERCESRALRALQTFRRLGDRVSVLRVLIIRARAAQALGRDSSEQVGDVDECLTEIRKKGSPLPASIFNGIGRAREGSGNLTGAQSAYEEGIALARDSDHDFSLAIGLTHLGDLFERRGKPEAAIQAHGKALRAREPSEDVLGKACSHRGLARAHLALGHTVIACEHITLCAELFQEASDLNGYVSSMLIMVLIQEQFGEPIKAIHLAKRAVSLLDSLGAEAIDQMGPTYDKVLAQVRAVLATDDA